MRHFEVGRSAGKEGGLKDRRPHCLLEVELYEGDEKDKRQQAWTVDAKTCWNGVHRSTLIYTIIFL